MANAGERMRHGTASRRSRNRGGNGGRRNQTRTQVYDSNGPDVRIRGTAHQICEKYLTLSKDASSSGDYILAESYMQHAEHYQRIINTYQEARSERENESESGKEETYTANKGNHAAQKEDDDLGLPASILSAGAESSEEKAEKELADA